MNNQIAFLIFEIKGIVETMSEMSSIDEHLDHPCIDMLKKKINEIAELMVENTQ